MEKSNDKIDVSYVANLARVHLTDEECDLFQGQMEQIVGYMQKINELDLDGIEPTYHTKAVHNVFREDICKEGLDRDVVLNNAPLSSDGQFTVPKMIE
jgi:aspartyl-tRNA(Asn)/glutamyl-tRNA(Gln) amidotransferase subunit C